LLARRLTRQNLGSSPGGDALYLFTLTNDQGFEATITNYGGILVSLKAPDRDGRLADVVLGYDTVDKYLSDNRPHFGATIGRYGNRIGRARFTLNGVEYQLAKNNGENSLHGGNRGFDQVMWTPRELSDGSLELSYLSPDGEEGFPGNLRVTVTFTLAGNSLEIGYAAATDQETVLNLTNHSYFNLKGAGEGDVLHHRVMLNADRYTPVDAGLIPTGELRSVAATPFDFCQPQLIGARIDQDSEQLRLGRGYDHNWVLNRSGGGLTLAARVEEPSTGRVLEVHTTEPGVQFYTANGLNISQGKGGKTYGPRSGFCLETQHFPDSPNHPGFPSTVLKPGQRFHSTTEFRFRTERQST
jgi:aldose 1-epimerase